MVLYGINNKYMTPHNLVFLFLSIAALLLIIIADSVYVNTVIIVFTLLNLLICGKLNIKLFGLALVFLLPLCVSLYIAWALFTSDNNLDLITHLISRTATLTISSIMFASAIDFEELIFYFMQRLKLTVAIGYPLLSAVNAFKNFKDEYHRIANASLMRYGDRRAALKILYPMLISATRYAFHNGLSMECRGLNNNKTFIHQVTLWSYKDSLFFIVNVLCFSFVVFGF